MGRSPAVMWTCLLGSGLTLAFCVITSMAEPQPPQLIDCVFRHRANITCRWEDGDTLTTSYTLHVDLMFEPKNRPIKTFTCSTSGTSCTAQFSDSVRNRFCITIMAHSHNRNISSNRRCQSGSIEVMLPPVPMSRVKSVSGRPECLNVTWNRTVSVFPVALSEIKDGKLLSQIKYTSQGQSDAQVKNVIGRDTWFEVCDFKPDTLYAVRLRHRFQSPKSPWSPWSNACQGRTGEDAPSAAPAFWRRVKQTDKDGWRLVSLLWKALPHFLANGKVLFFNVTCQTEGAQDLSDLGGCGNLHHTSTSCSLLLPAGRCSCALTASTSVGSSPKARVWLSGASETEPPPPSQITVSPLGDSRLDVHWTTSVSWSTSGFVVEWFAVREKNSGILHWEKLNSSCTGLVITEGVKPMERYAVTVKALYNERGTGQSSTVQIYTRQGAPSAGPKVVVQQISGSRVELKWSPVPVEQLHGFIRNYTIYYTTANRPARRVTVPGHALRHSLEHLPSGNYDIFMKANTDAGAGAAGPIANVHIGSEEIKIVMYAVLPLILTSLALVLMVCLAQNKRVKQKLCQNVPDPSNSTLAHWTPKMTLESMKQPAMTEKTNIKCSEVILLGESELQNFDPDQDLSYETYSSPHESLLPDSGAQTAQNTRRSENKYVRASTASCSSIYSNVVFSQGLDGVPSPYLCPYYLQSNDWQHSTVSDIKLQLGGNSEPCVSLQGRSTTRSDSPLSQRDDLKTFHVFQRQHQSPVFSHLSSAPLFHPAEVTSPQHLFSQSLCNSVPSLQHDPFACPSDTFTTPFSPYVHSALVDFSYCPVECDPYISPSV
ncbi:hypothetical protein ABVT39_017514 [Epinephelus coioides]